jgi:hypothetical protein
MSNASFTGRRGYLLHAVKCQEKADEADDPRIKEMWSNLAARWREMALKAQNGDTAPGNT